MMSGFVNIMTFFYFKLYRKSFEMLNSAGMMSRTNNDASGEGIMY